MAQCKMASRPVIGIDLGTTQSCVGIFRDGQVEIIPNDQGNRTTPSCVAFIGPDRFLGENAKNLEVTCPKNTIFDMKRLIGRKFSDPSIQVDIEHWPFTTVSRNDHPRVIVHFNGEAKTFSPEEISAMVLTKMKESAEAYLQTTVNDVVITVPAYFNDSQRRATRDAGEIAGLNVLRIINEPTAAALAYGMEKKLTGKQNIMVFDLGGGTFDVSILTVVDNVNFEVRSTEGDTHLGGEDFDLRIVDYFAEEFWRKYNRNLKTCPRSLRRLKKACEIAKRYLSTNMEATVEVDSLFEKIDFSSKISRARFEDLCIDLFRSTIKLAEQALENARMTKDDIDQLILVGGSTRIPKIRKLLEEFMKDVRITCDIHPDEVVAYGAALKAAIVSGQSDESLGKISLIEIVRASLGIETAGHRMTKFIHKNTRIPIRVSKEFTTFFDDQRSAIIRVFEGEQELTTDNRFLGQFEVTIPPAPKGKVHIAVILELDINGILNVEIVDEHTGMSTHIIIQDSQLQRETDTMLTEVDQQKHRLSECAYGGARERLMNARCLISEYKYVLTDTERQDVIKACHTTLEWLGEYPQCLQEEYEERKRELCRAFAPLMVKLPCSVATLLKPDDLLAEIWGEMDFDRNN